MCQEVDHDTVIHFDGLYCMLACYLQVRKLELFSAKEHINSVAPLQHGSLWAILQNLGEASTFPIVTN